jgi:ketosteroid isomerase-like protein
MEDDQSTILQLEQETMEAIRNKDTSSLSRILADDFIYRTPSGDDTSKADFLNNIGSLSVDILSISGENLKVNIYGESAVLTGIQRVTARDSQGNEEPGAVAFVDIFARRQGKWLMVLAYGVDLPITNQ